LILFIIIYNIYIFKYYKINLMKRQIDKKNKKLQDAYTRADKALQELFFVKKETWKKN